MSWTLKAFQWQLHKLFCNYHKCVWTVSVLHIWAYGNGLARETPFVFWNARGEIKKEIIHTFTPSSQSLVSRVPNCVANSTQNITGPQLPSLHDIYRTRCLRWAKNKIKGSCHPGNHLFTLLPPGGHYRSIKTCTSGLLKNVYHGWIMKPWAPGPGRVTAFKPPLILTKTKSENNWQQAKLITATSRRGSGLEPPWAHGPLGLGQVGNR